MIPLATQRAAIKRIDKEVFDYITLKRSQRQGFIEKEAKVVSSLKTNRYPLGTFKSWNSYRRFEKVPQDEFKTLSISKIGEKDGNSMLFCGQSGTQKTTQIKRIAYYHILKGYKVIVFDLKGDLDWEMVNRMGITEKLHPEEVHAKINMLAGCPSYVKTDAEGQPQLPKPMEDKLATFDLSLRKLALSGDSSVLRTVGFSPTSILKIKELVIKYDTLKLIEQHANNDKIHPMARMNLTATLMSCMNANFFIDTPESFDINKYWDRGQHVALAFMAQSNEYISAYVHRILLDINHRAVHHLKEKYLVIIDDAHLAFGNLLDPSVYGSIKMGINMLTLGRYKGISMIFSTQSPTMLNSEILFNIKHSFIANMGNVDFLVQKNMINDPEIMEVIKDLDYYPDKYVVEWCHIFPNKRDYETYYPLGSPIGHAW